MESESPTFLCNPVLDNQLFEFADTGDVQVHSVFNMIVSISSITFLNDALF